MRADVCQRFQNTLNLQDFLVPLCWIRIRALLGAGILRIPVIDDVPPTTTADMKNSLSMEILTRLRHPEVRYLDRHGSISPEVKRKDPLQRMQFTSQRYRMGTSRRALRAPHWACREGARKARRLVPIRYLCEVNCILCKGSFRFTSGLMEP